MAAHPDSPRFFAADKKIVSRIEHDLSDVFKTDRSFKQPETIALGNPLDDHRLRKCAYDRPSHSFVTNQVEEQDHENLMRIDVTAVFGQGSDPVGVTICDQRHQCPTLTNGASSQFEVPRHRLREYAAEVRVAVGADRFDANFSAGQDFFNPTPPCSMHGIGNDLRICITQLLKVYEIFEVTEVIVGL